jgi:hypothetical protein
MKHSIWRLSRKRPQTIAQIIRCRKGLDVVCEVVSFKCGLLAEQQYHLITFASKKIRQLRAESPGGEISESANLIEWFVRGPRRDNTPHEVKLVILCEGDKVS